MKALDNDILWTDVMRPRVTAVPAVEDEHLWPGPGGWGCGGAGLQGGLGVEEFSLAFLCSPGVDPKLVPDGMMRNHYRWIVWRLDNEEAPGQGSEWRQA